MKKIKVCTVRPHEAHGDFTITCWPNARWGHPHGPKLPAHTELTEHIRPPRLKRPWSPALTPHTPQGSGTLTNALPPFHTAQAAGRGRGKVRSLPSLQGEDRERKGVVTQKQWQGTPKRTTHQDEKCLEVVHSMSAYKTAGTERGRPAAAGRLVVFGTTRKGVSRGLNRRPLDLSYLAGIIKSGCMRKEP